MSGEIETDRNLTELLISKTTANIAENTGLPLEMVRHVSESWPMVDTEILFGIIPYRGLVPVYDRESIYPVRNREVKFYPDTEERERGLPKKREGLLNLAYFETYLFPLKAVREEGYL